MDDIYSKEGVKHRYKKKTFCKESKKKIAFSYYSLPKKGNESVSVSYLKNFKLIYFPSFLFSLFFESNNKIYDFE